MKFLIFLLQFVLLICKIGSNFHFNQFYFELNNIRFPCSIINKNISKVLLGQIPLEDKMVFNDDYMLSIYLDSKLKQDVEDSMNLIQKGDIFTDGVHLIIYYGDSYEIIKGKYYTLLGQLDNANFLLRTFLQQPNNIHFRVECQSSVLADKNISITLSNPYFYIFSKESLDFDDVPNLYFDKNGDPLYSYCKINENKRHEIKCSFSKDDIMNYYFNYGDSLQILEVIPGCQDFVQTGIYIHFKYEIPHCLKQANQKCLICDLNKYKLSDDGKECKLSSFFYFMCIGLPIIDICFITLVIILNICECLPSKKKGTITFDLMFVFVIVNFIILMFYFYSK
jgi:hypothetical protein